MSAYLPANAANHKLVLLSGDEGGLRRLALRNLLEEAGGDPFDTQSVIAGETSANEWISAASTVPFLSERRTVVVRNLLRVAPKDALSDPSKELGQLPESARLVLVADDEATTDIDRIRRLESIRKAWEGEIRKAGGLVVEFKVDPRSLKSEVAKAAAEQEKTLEDRAAELLVEMTGRNLSRALEELEKVALYVGDTAVIRERDVAAAALPSREWNVFKLVDSIVEGNAGQALSELRTLVGSGAKAEGAAMQNVFPNLSRNLRLIWQAKICQIHRSDPRAPSDEVRMLLPEQGAISAATDWQRNRASAAARKLTLGQLAECLQVVATTDARMKGLEPSFSGSDALERMVLEMVEAVRPAAAGQRL